MTILSKPHKKVLVLGNGFDLNLGLETRYSDFMRSNYFRKLLKSNSFFEYLQDKQNLSNWIDIEIELKMYSFSHTDPDFEKDHISLCASLSDYISSIDYNYLNKSSAAYQLIEEIHEDDFIIFDYNYTDSVIQIGQKIGCNIEYLRDRTIKVHGSAKENNIVFGVEDSANITRPHIFLKKSYPIHYKGISLADQLENASEVHFFGHSLGETDHTYFDHFFSIAANGQIRRAKKDLFLYYHTQDSYRELLYQLDQLTGKRLAALRQNHEFKPTPVK